MDDPFEVENRKKFSPKQRLEIFLAHNGICVLCDNKIQQNVRWIVEHILPLWLGGSNEPDNLGPAHLQCAKDKTSREAFERAKGKRIRAKQDGTRPRKIRLIPGSKQSGWKRTFDGRTIRRESK